MSRVTGLPLLLCAALATACASPRVHLFTEGVDEKELNEVVGKLEAAGFDTALNPLPVPEAIIGPTVLYSPSPGSVQTVEGLGDLLLDLGYDVMVEAVAKRNHFYTKNNFGVYLGRLVGNRQGNDGSLENWEFNGDCPDLDAYLQFEGGRFTIEYIAWDEGAEEEVVTRETGLWQRDGSTVSLFMDELHVDLFLTPVQNETQYGSISGIKLLNDTELLKSCSFVYREFGTL